MYKDIYYNMCNDGGALIRPTEKGFELYEIPLYGGEPRFYDTFNTIEEAKKIADGWT